MAGSTSTTTPVSLEAAAEAERVKTEANQLFQANKYEQAAELYSKAIELNPTLPAYYCNRALAYLKTESYGYALADANKAIELDPSFIKAYYRRATANTALLRFKDALRDFRTVVQRVPTDPDARKKLDEMEKVVKRQNFEKAIATDDEGGAARSVLDNLDYEAIVVEASYSGPRLDGPITPEFAADLLAWMKDQKLLHRKYVFKLLVQAKAILKPLNSLVDIPLTGDQHITVCGDTHGQFYDLLNIFEEVTGMPTPTNPYLFNGDYVDRGSFSVEVAITMFAFKVLYPDHFHITRGNHETNDMNKIYGFEGEVKHKYNETMFKVFAEVFNCIPLAACIAGKVLVVHGGLFTRDGVKLSELRAIDRFRQPGSDGNVLNTKTVLVSRGSEIDFMVPMRNHANFDRGVHLGCVCGLSSRQPGRAPSKRGVGIQFGPDVTERFLQDNNLELLIRSHEAKDNGYEIHHGGKCITVFSAPNYCDQLGNKGAVVRLTTTFKPKFVSFSAVPHPSVKPMAYASNYSMMGL